MLVDLHCPVELKGYEILTDSIANRTFCAVSFFNLSDSIVASVRFNLFCYDSFGDPVGGSPSNKVEAVIQDENALPKSVFGIKKRIPLPMHSETRAIEIIVSRIKFADGTIWDNDEKGIIRVNIATIIDLDELYALKTIIGEDAICYFQEEENWWICLCSRVNTFNDAICRRCGRAKEYIYACCSEKSRVNYEFELHKQREEKERKKNLLIEQENRDIKPSPEEEERKKHLAVGATQKINSLDKNKSMYWYFKVLRDYALFSGRARRKEYWMFTLFNVIFITIASLLDTLLFGIHIDGIGPLYVIYALGVFIPSLAVLVRRLHDVGKSGWWILIIFIPIVGAVWLFILTLLDSQPGENEYGSNPKEI